MDSTGFGSLPVPTEANMVADARCITTGTIRCQPSLADIKRELQDWIEECITLPWAHSCKMFGGCEICMISSHRTKRVDLLAFIQENWKSLYIQNSHKYGPDEVSALVAHVDNLVATLVLETGCFPVEPCPVDHRRFHGPAK